MARDHYLGEHCIAFTGPSEDRLAIRELYGTYADVSSREDKAGWLALWARDCHWTSPLFDRHGHAALAEQWDRLWATFEALAFYAEVGAIEVAGDTALGRCCTREIVRQNGGGIYRLAARYDDALVREGGTWLFARRSLTPIIEELSAP